MKKCFFPILMLVCIAFGAFVAPMEARGETVLSIDQTTNDYSLSDGSVSKVMVICEPYVLNFHSRTIEISHSENTHLHGKLFKYKLFDKENLRIEKFVKNYVVYNNYLAYHHRSCIKLQRLNI